MATGIILCGLNGTGKSTLGRALAARLGFHFIDNERLFFPDAAAYAHPRSREEVERLLLQEVQDSGNFVFAAVRGDYGQAILPFYTLAVLLEVPKEQRAQRVRARSYQKFGARMLPGGDLYEQEEGFFRMAQGREEAYVEGWVQSLRCPVLRVDGTRPVLENLEYLLGQAGLRATGGYGV